jgi:predicted DNA-binding transcriptional regulator AlpA
MTHKSHDDLAARHALPRLLTIGDLADWLHVTSRTIDRMVQRGQLPRPMKLGGNRWMVEDIEKALGAIVLATRGPAQTAPTTE